MGDNPGMNSQSFAEALARARMLAAKLGGAAAAASGNGGGGGGPNVQSPQVGMKRGPDMDYGRSEPEPKRLAAISDPFGAQLAAMKGGGSGPPGGNMGMGMGNPYANNMGIRMGNGISGSGEACNEEIHIPDALVGLIIGRGGEQISKIQAETGCKVQVAPDSGGSKERSVSLTGNRRCIEKCKDMIMDIVSSKSHEVGKSHHPGLGFAGGPGGPKSGQTTVEVMIAGAKVGLIIGKGGETIRNLQEKTGTKMYILQENMFEECDKPLRIVGEPDLVEHARQMVLELLNDSPIKHEFKSRNEYGGGEGGGGGGGQLARGFETMKFPVPKVSVGLIIGKGGDMIKRIQMDTGAKVQFDPINSNMGDMDEQLAIITGKPDQIRLAQLKIEELVETALNGGAQGGGGGGRDRGRGYEGSVSRGGPRGDYEEERLVVPVNRVGMVIGKGGETIRQINQQAGAHCEIDRNLPQDGPERTFVIKGSREQIEHAKELIMEKVNTLPPGKGGPRGDREYGGQGGGSWGSSYGSSNGNSSSQWSGDSSKGGGATSTADATAQWAAYYAQYYAQAAAAPQAAAGQTTDYTQQWIDYYRSQGQHAQADMLEAQAKAAKPGDTTAPTPNSSNGNQPPNPGTNGANPPGMPAAAAGGANSVDYSQQWADHYRAMGKIQEAEAIEAYIKQQKAGGAAVPANPAPGAPTAAQAGYTAGYPGYNYGAQQFGSSVPQSQRPGVSPPGE